jgi:phosphohistidine phosphatase SixA
MIVILLRHADRADADELSPAGEQRAKLLARMLADAGVSVAFHSQYKRTAKTLAPLQEKLAKLQVREITYDDPTDPDGYARKIAAAIDGLPDDSVVAVVGHDNSIGPTIAHLSRGKIDKIDEIATNEFDKLFVLFTGPDRPALLKLRYGAPTPPAA